MASILAAEPASQAGCDRQLLKRLTMISTYEVITSSKSFVHELSLWRRCVAIVYIGTIIDSGAIDTCMLCICRYLNIAKCPSEIAYLYY